MSNTPDSEARTNLEQVVFSKVQRAIDYNGSVLQTAEEIVEYFLALNQATYNQGAIDELEKMFAESSKYTDYALDRLQALKKGMK